jgi:hypothetical protein
VRAWLATGVARELVVVVVVRDARAQRQDLERQHVDERACRRCPSAWVLCAVPVRACVRARVRVSASVRLRVHACAYACVCARACVRARASCEY